ncbi:hypothetical protein IFM12276_07940 [Nocardia sputorum]|uniref:Amino acid permease n=1 Tax=Nocardia sputorum TaxID=2984338 RepID=A0ABM8CS35_9NOCA|nr:amino acid permease [Nocardia sputorum]BDT97765.1 hypothetical protein IFM12276_07940 [Nocardia sputorum]
MDAVVTKTQPQSSEPGIADRRFRQMQRADKFRLTAVGGLAALSLDALSSVAYGPEAIVLVLVAAGAAAVAWTLPVSCAIAALLLVLVLSYRQVIAVHPDGGGAYAVAKKQLGRPAALLAAASLVVDYVLTVAVSLAAGAASLASAFPALADELLPMTLAGLAALTVINLIGVAESARVLMGPAILFVVLITGVIVVGLLRPDPVAVIGADRGPIEPVEALGIVLLLKAFAAGCSSLTGVEAIANAVPAFRTPAVRRAQRTEVALGVLLGAMLLGLAVLIREHHVTPRGDVTILAQLSAAAFGTGWLFYLTNLAVTAVLLLAANTSFGGLPCCWRCWPRTTGRRRCSRCAPSDRSSATESPRSPCWPRWCWFPLMPKRTVCCRFSRSASSSASPSARPVWCCTGGARVGGDGYRARC